MTDRSVLVVVTHGEGDGTIVLDVSGDLDMASSAALVDAVRAASATDCRVIVDLGRVRFVDVRGLRALLSAHEQCVGRGIGFSLRRASLQARRLFELAGCREFLVVRSDGHIEAVTPQDR